jgi:hypothetical protein
MSGGEVSKMAYTINGKVYSDHPLMDAMVYNLGIIMKNIEIKNEELALSYESEESIEASDTFMSIKSEVISFDTFPFTDDMLIAYGYDRVTASKYAADKTTIPKFKRDEIFEFCTKYFVEHYEEKNNYYRSLMGLPWLDEEKDIDAYYVYIDSSYIEDDMLKEVFDFSLPLHKYDNYQIAVLTALGVLDKLYEEYPDKQYKYLHFLDNSKIDLYTARKAPKFDIIYIPSVEIMVSDRFKQLYQANRTLYLQRYYSEAYKVASDYYDEFMIIMLLCQTYTDMIADIPEWYVRRDVFDLRSCQYFLESNGIEFFKEIPLRYQVRIVKNMNKLIRYKSTNKNIWDIIELFSVDATVYKHYLFKKRIANEQGSYATGKNPEDEYELEFVKAPIGESYDDTIKDNIYRVPYDDITYEDKWWDGEKPHADVRNDHLTKEFTIEGTKFISLESVVSLSNYSFQVEYFFGLLLDSNMSTSDIEINIPSISSITSFSLSDLFILLYCLTASYDGYRMLIRTPTNMRTKEKSEFVAYEDIDGGYVFTNEAEIELYGGGPGVQAKYRKNVDGGYTPKYSEITQESYYNWLSWRHPDVWLDMSARVYGFNMDADLEWLADAISFRHSSFQFSRGYTLEDLGVDGFLTTKNISTIDDLVNVYETNSAIHDNLKDMIYDAQTRDEKVVFQFVFDYLFTRKFDYSRYTLRSTGELAESYDQVLKERNYVLYRYYVDITNESDLDTRQDHIRSAMNDIINTLEYYLNYDSLRNIFSIFTVTSFTNVLHYIYLMINFFKSFKVYFLDTYVTYQTDDRLNCNIEMVDNIGEIETTYLKPDKFLARDTSETNVTYEKFDKLLQRDMSIQTSIFNKADKSNMRDAATYATLFYKTDLVTMRDTIHSIDNSFEFKDGPHFQYKEVLDVYGFQDADPTIDYNLIGGFYDTEDDEFDRDINCGYVDYTTFIPYIMYNGGRQGAGKALFDLDGAGAAEQAYYVEVDGTVPDPKKELHRKTESFNFSVDGGHPSMFYYMSRSMSTRIVDNQICFEVRLHGQYRGKDNMLAMNEDGLYLKNIYAGEEDYVDMTNTMAEDLESLRNYYNDSLEQIQISQDPNLANIYVNKVTVSYFRRAIDVIQHFDEEYNKTVTINENYSDEKADELYEQWSTALSELDLGEWGTF